MSKVRHILMVLAMTTALCADHMAAAAPVSGARTIEFAEMAQRLVSRLGESFRDTVPVALQQPARHARPATRLTAEVAACPAPAVAHNAGTPFQFRLPPPFI